MAETLVIEKSRPTIVDIFVGLAVVISAFLFPVVMFGVLLLCIVVAGVGGKRYGNFFVGLVMVWFTWRFPMVVLGALLISLLIIAVGKAVAPRRPPLHAGS
jgi:hypothetical protein